MKQKILMTLVLLMTVASGAWADEVTIGDPTSTSTSSALPSNSWDNYSFTQQIYTADEIGMSGTITTLTMWLMNPSSCARNIHVYMKEVSGSIFEADNSWVSLSADDLVGTATINNGVSNPTETTFTLETPFEYSGTGNLLICIHDITGDWSAGIMEGVSFETVSNQSLYVSRDASAFDISNPGVNGTLTTKKNVVRLEIEKSGLEVTTNAAEEGATFTEAWFNMPAFDATANYDIVRDMADTDNPVEFSGIAERVVVKQGGDNKYQPLTTLTIQLIDDISGSDVDIISADGITIKVLKGTLNGTTIEYDETNPLTLAEFTANMEPGLYKIVAEPTDATTSPYTGTASLEFQTLTGFPVDVPAKEYVTYYTEDNNLTVDNANAALYTITGVSGSTATATEITSANKEMPFLVYNSSDTKQTIILIPTDTEINQTFYSGFKGTTTAATIAASTNAQSNYAFNGKQFVIVRTNLAVAANKAWLEVPATTARNIQLVFADDDATAIGAASGSPADNGDVYDLSGRKLDKKPTRKGIYVKNGQKVIIK